MEERLKAMDRLLVILVAKVESLETAIKGKVLPHDVSELLAENVRLTNENTFLKKVNAQHYNAHQVIEQMTMHGAKMMSQVNEIKRTIGERAKELAEQMIEARKYRVCVVCTKHKGISAFKKNGDVCRKCQSDK